MLLKIGLIELVYCK